MPPSSLRAPPAAHGSNRPPASRPSTPPSRQVRRDQISAQAAEQGVTLEKGAAHKQAQADWQSLPPIPRNDPPAPYGSLSALRQQVAQRLIDSGDLSSNPPPPASRKARAPAPPAPMDAEAAPQLPPAALPAYELTHELGESYQEHNAYDSSAFHPGVGHIEDIDD